MSKITEIEDSVAFVERIFDVEFSNKALLVQALTHRSYLNEQPNHPHKHYERLEFLGDAVLELIVTEQLYRRDEDAEEGEMTNQRAALVNSEVLGKLVCELGIPERLFMGKGQRRDASNQKVRTYMACCFFEAFLGALYLDQGIGPCRMVVDHFLLSRLTRTIISFMDHKSVLQEALQAQFGITPNYRVLHETGPNHARQFVVGCFLGDLCVAEGDGQSKREAEKAAARKAYETQATWEGRITQSVKAGSVMRHSTKEEAE